MVLANLRWCLVYLRHNAVNAVRVSPLVCRRRRRDVTWKERGQQNGGGPASETEEDGVWNESSLQNSRGSASGEEGWCKEENWKEDEISRGSDAGKRAGMVGSSARLIPALHEASVYRDDFRFVSRKQFDRERKKKHRQYVCDSCFAVCTRKSTRAPEYDGECLHKHQLPKGVRGPTDLEKAWRDGWNATWWCTSCWIQHLWKMHPRFDNKLKNRMRFQLGILTGERLSQLWRNSRWYEDKGNWRASPSKHYQVQVNVAGT